MTSSAAAGAVTLSLVLTERLAHMLAATAGENFYDELAPVAVARRA